MDKTGFILTGSALLLLMTNLAHSQEDYDDYSNHDSPVHPSKGSIPNVADIMRTFLAEQRTVNGSNHTVWVVGKRARQFLTGPLTTATIPALYILVFVIGLPTNGLGLWVMANRVRKLPSTIFLMNLAVADLLLSLVLPFKIHYHILGNNWLFGEALCRTVTAFFYGNMYCSVLLLTFISIDRYFALVHPFLSKRFRDNSFAVGSCCVIWLLAVLLVLPFLFLQQLYTIHNLNITTCHDVLPLESQAGYFFYYFVCLVALGFLVPGCVTVFCYGSVIRTLIQTEKRYVRATVLTVLILLVFVVCFAPSNFILLVHQSEYRLYEDSELYIYYMLGLGLSSCSSCIDPFIYYYVSDEFRAKVKRAVYCQKDKGSALSGKSSQELLSATTYTPSTRAASLTRAT
ncbi:proteinase-activated receptor 3-like isoform X2 [Stegostoma tigrinum]|uniref:proteinase-activated receptor 3-like isoform X2 n=1 Tax=Stegostoma tigrinum TaxID=3053191 RepID=UPI0028709F80|nr:proteinase-activated receptor 3-like isoform X2 [Stegostoma tigrinum]